MYDDDRDALAAEYVLGTLSADERDQAEALLVIDPGFAEIVRVWERRLGELNVMVEAVEPPPDVWDKIRTEIDGAEPRAAAEAETVTPAIEEAAPQIAPEPCPTVAAADAGAGPGDSSRGRSPRRRSRREIWMHCRRRIWMHRRREDLDDDVAGCRAGFEPAAAGAASRRPRTPSPPEPPSAMRRRKTERSADIVYLARDVRRWRGFTVAMSAIAALLAVYIAVAQFAPGLHPAGPAVAAGGRGANAAARRPARRGVAAGSDRAGIFAHGRSAKPHHDGAPGYRDARTPTAATNCG